jgi:hypothetical protein
VFTPATIEVLYADTICKRNDESASDSQITTYDRNHFRKLQKKNFCGCTLARHAQQKLDTYAGNCGMDLCYINRNLALESMESA